MSSIAEFIRRNKGKILAGTVIAGGAYLAQKFIRDYYEEQRQMAADRNLAAAATAAFGMDQQRMMLQNRRFYIFDSNQRTCENSILQIIPSLKTTLQKRFDVESSADHLKQIASTEADTAFHKLEIWNQMKTDSFARLLAASISYTTLVLSLKVQISILASQIYENSIQSVPNPYESWSSRIFYALGGRPADVKPRTGGAKKKFDVSGFKNSTAVQQLFLQSLQYFVKKGVDSLTDHIQPIVAERMASYSLKEPITIDHLKKLIDNLRSSLISTDSSTARHFSFYVVPLTHTGSLPDEPILEELLIILKTVLESPEAQQMFDFGMDSLIDGAIKYVINTVPEYSDGLHRLSDQQASTSSKKSSSVPLARLIPVITDAFHEISKVNFDSAVSNFVISQDMNDFCMKVFDRDQNIW